LIDDLGSTINFFACENINGVENQKERLYNLPTLNLNFARDIVS
jgi:hypothetical protein